MPYRRKDSPVWWVSYTDANGQRVRQPTGTTNRKEAELLEAKWKLEIHRERRWGEQPLRSFGDLMLGYLRATADKRSADKDRMRTKHLRRAFGGMVMNEITPAHIRAYVDGRKSEGIGNATINRELALLSAAINYANKEWEWALPNPVKGRKLKEPEDRVRWLTTEEVEKLVRAAETEPKALHLAVFIRLALNTGCRSGELLGLEWSRVDFQGSLIYLEARHTKAGKRRSVPLNDAAGEALIDRARFRRSTALEVRGCSAGQTGCASKASNGHSQVLVAKAGLRISSHTTCGARAPHGWCRLG